MPPLPRSLPRICVALGLSTPSQLNRAAEAEYKDGNTFLEFRLDYLRDPSAAYKIATTACKPSDNLRLLQFAREHRDLRLITLAMSEIGTPSRVLAPSLGSAFTYAAPLENESTAPGQLSAKVMHTLFRCE